MKTIGNCGALWLQRTSVLKRLVRMVVSDERGRFDQVPESTGIECLKVFYDDDQLGTS
jgi:hypothetical protein